MCKTYKDAFPNVKRGIFSYMGRLPPDETETDSNYIPLVRMVTANAATLDRIMYAEYGGRVQNALLESYVLDDIATDYERETAKAELASMVKAICWAQWAHMWKAVSADYDPIANYNATETEITTLDASALETESVNETTENNVNRIETAKQTNDLTDSANISRNLHDTHSGTDSVTGENTERLRVLGAETGKERNSVSGLNETKYGQRIDYGGTESDITRRTGSVSAENGADISGNVERGQTREMGHDRAENTIRTLRRAGNIGVTTSAQMIQGELNLWRDYSYFRQMCNDAADVLTLPIWS